MPSAGALDILKWPWMAYRRHLSSIVPSDQQLSLNAALKAETLVRAYFAYLLYHGFTAGSRYSRQWAENNPRNFKLNLELTSLAEPESWLVLAMVAGVVSLFGSILATTWPRQRWARIAAVAGFIVCRALMAEDKGKVDHGMHAAMWAGVALCFLPKLDPEKLESTRSYLLGFLHAQITVGLLYSCAGICKLLGMYFDYAEGVTWLAADALPLTIAENWGKSKYTLLGGWMITHPQMGRLLNISTVYLELFALVAAFRPRLHRLWGLGLTGMHTGIVFSMYIHFHQSIVILLLFFVASPLIPSGKPWEAAKALPLFGGLVRLLSRSPKPSMPTSQVPGSRLSRLYAPILIPVYLFVSFGRLDVETEEWEEDPFPFAGMWMYWRIDSSPRNVKNLERIRAHLEKKGTVSPWQEVPTNEQKRRQKEARRKKKAARAAAKKKAEAKRRAAAKKKAEEEAKQRQAADEKKLPSPAN